MYINRQQLPPTNWRMQEGWDVTYWEHLRERYQLQTEGGHMTEEKRTECEQILAAEGLVSYRVSDNGEIIPESSLKDSKLVHKVAWALVDYEQSVIRCMESNARTRLQQIQNKFGDFKDQLAISLPELATRRFGFVINERGDLDVTSTEELTDQEKRQLNGWLNNFDDLKEMTIGHAEFVVAMCKAEADLKYKSNGQDRAHTGLDKYAEIISLKNIGQFIDYGLLLQNPGSKPGEGYSWREQLEANGDKLLKELAAAKAEAEAKKAPID